MRYAVFLLFLALASCDKPPDPDEFKLRDLTLPGGRVIKVETMIGTADLRRGMTYRTSLAPDHGMLFVHPKSDNYPYWMYHIMIPLDIIWIDADHKIVEMVVNAQPCKLTPDKCPQYLSARPAHYVLELPGGTAKKYNLGIGQQVTW
ncbi:MAG TPA: DUF192 domain-containing protein [Bryobacteraceae bacterium]|nr:DUF192 domain-containing protein [Bryobacteraceae bacterium]